MYCRQTLMEPLKAEHLQGMRGKRVYFISHCQAHKRSAFLPMMSQTYCTPTLLSYGRDKPPRRRVLRRFDAGRLLRMYRMTGCLSAAERQGADLWLWCCTSSPAVEAASRCVCRVAGRPLAIGIYRIEGCCTTAQKWEVRQIL